MSRFYDPRCMYETTEQMLACICLMYPLWLWLKVLVMWFSCSICRPCSVPAVARTFIPWANAIWQHAMPTCVTDRQQHEGHSKSSQTNRVIQEIWAYAHEMRESLEQFLFANCQSISSHFVAVHS